MEDSAIIALFWNRSEHAVRETDAAYGRQGRRLAKNIVGSDEDAEECVNDAYLHLWQAIPPERPICFGAYFLRTVRNLALNRLKEKKTTKRGGGHVAVAWEELSEVLPERESVEEQLAVKRLGEVLNRFLADQPKEKRILFVMRYWYGDSMQVIAKASGFSVGKVKMILWRMRGALRTVLEQEGIEL